MQLIKATIFFFIFTFVTIKLNLAGFDVSKENYAKRNLFSAIETMVASSKSVKHLIKNTLYKSNPTFRDEILFLYYIKLLKKNNILEALKTINIIIEKFPDARYKFDNWFTAPYGTHDYKKGELLARKKYYIYRDENSDFSSDMAIITKTRILNKIGRSAEAIKLLSAYIAKYPEGRLAHFDKKNEKLRRFYLIRAEERIRFLLCKIFMESENFSDAIALLCKSLEIYQHGVSYLLFLELLSLCHQKTHDVYNEKIILNNLIAENKRRHRENKYITYINGCFILGNRHKPKPQALTEVKIIMRPNSVLVKRLAEL